MDTGTLSNLKSRQSVIVGCNSLPLLCFVYNDGASINAEGTGATAVEAVDNTAPVASSRCSVACTTYLPNSSSATLRASCIPTVGVHTNMQKPHGTSTRYVTASTMVRAGNAATAPGSASRNSLGLLTLEPFKISSARSGNLS